jgi:predicted nucleic-acid-binding Zn-ribbon protein
MGLPTINAENHYISTKVPSGKSIGVCGWKVKEEKELLFALEMEENVEETKISHIINLLKQCVDDKAKFNSLSENDLVKVAIETRKLAKGDTVEYNYECPKCGTKFFDEVNLTTEQVVKQFDVSPLTVNDKLTVTFKDLDWVKVEALYKASSSSSKFTFKHLINSIDSITYDGTTHTEFSADEAEGFIDQLGPNDMKVIYEGFEARLSTCMLSRTVKCLKCKDQVEINFGDFLSFLVL